MSDRCADLPLARLLASYELGLLGPADTHRFEAHLLACESCFEKLVEADNVMPDVRRLVELRREGAARS